MNPRLQQLDRLDGWLLSLTKWQLRQFALLLGLAINFPNAWLLARCPSAFDQPGLPLVAAVSGVGIADYMQLTPWSS